MAAGNKKLTRIPLFTVAAIAFLLTLVGGEVPPPIAAAVPADSPSHGSPFLSASPTDYPDFYSTHYYLDDDDDDDGGWAKATSFSSTSRKGASTDAPRRRSADPPEVRCALNRTSASLCKSSGVPIGCACDKLCHVYGDCCSDATSMTKLESDPEFLLWRSYWWSCRKVAAEIPSPHYLMVSYCPTSWKDEYTQHLCRNYNLYDRLLNWPVHDADNGALFKNVFCAKCNGVERVVFWSANVRCKKDFFHFKRKDALPAARGNVTAFQVNLNPDAREPQLLQPQKRLRQRIAVSNVSMADEVERIVAEATLHRIDASEKAECALQYVPVEDHLSRSCLPFKSDCDSLWRGDIDVKMECLNGDTSFVFDAENVAYRNVHCAQCSFVDKLWCFARKRRKQVRPKTTPPVVASVQLYANGEEDGAVEQILHVHVASTATKSHAGSGAAGKRQEKSSKYRRRRRRHKKRGLRFKESIQCPPNQIYDVFHDRCRWLSCENGVVVNKTICQMSSEKENQENEKESSAEVLDGSVREDNATRASSNDTRDGTGEGNVNGTTNPLPETASSSGDVTRAGKKRSGGTPCDGILFALSKDDSNDLPYQKIFRVLDFYSKIRSLFDTHADDDDFLYNEKRDRPLVHCYQSSEEEIQPRDERLPAPFGVGELPLLSFFAALGQGVSVLCLLICILLCLSLENLRHSLLSSCLACIYLSLALCQVAMIVGTPAFRHEDLTCLLLFACWHYMSLTTLTWMSATAVLVLPAFLFSGTRSPLYVQEIFLRDPRQSPDGHRRNCLRFTFASILSWLLPFPLTALYVLEKHDALPPFTLDPDEINGLGLNLCWPSGRDGFLTYFAVPAGSLLFFALLILCTVSVHVARVGSSIYPDTLALRSWSNRLVRVIVVLTCLWSLCAAAVITDVYEIWLGFVCVNSITGVALLVDILYSVEVKKACRCFRRLRRRGSSEPAAKEEVKMEMVVGRDGDRMVGGDDDDYDDDGAEVKNREIEVEEKKVFVAAVASDDVDGEPVAL